MKNATQFLQANKAVLKDKQLLKKTVSYVKTQTKSEN